MSLPAISMLYAGALGILAVVLSMLIGPLRMRSGTSIYDGGNPQLGAAIRRHGNFSEHVPLALILLSLIELGGASPLLLHGLGGTLLVARVVHPFGLDPGNLRNPLRLGSALATTLVQLVASGVALRQALLG